MTDLELTPEMVEALLDKLSPEAASSLAQSLSVVMSADADPAARKAKVLQEQYELRKLGRHAEADALNAIVEALDQSIANQGEGAKASKQIQWLFVGTLGVLLAVTLIRAASR